MLGVHRRQTSAQVALVLDVVVDQKRVVQYFDGLRGRQRVPDLATERAARRETQCRSDALPRSRQVRRHRSVKMALRLALRDSGQQASEGGLAIVRELSLKRIERHLSKTYLGMISTRPERPLPAAVVYVPCLVPCASTRRKASRRTSRSTSAVASRRRSDVTPGPA